MKLPFINEGIFKPHKSLIEKEEFCCVCVYTHTCVILNLLISFTLDFVL